MSRHLSGPVPIITAIGIVILALLISAAVLIVTRSVLTARRDARRDAARPAIREAMLDRMNAADPEWESWVADLDTTDRAVATELLQWYLRNLAPEDRTPFQQLERVLEIDTRARDTLEASSRFDTLEALTWLALLDVAVSVQTLRETCLDHPETRAAAARLLYEQDHPMAQRIGTDFLLTGTQSLSVLGLDTLYELNKHDPDQLVTMLSEHYDRWSESLLIQVLRVIREAAPASDDVSLYGLGFLLVHASPRVRAAAADALADYGWHDEVRAFVDVEMLCADQSAQVRQSAYRMLAAWGDQPAQEALRAAVHQETDPRAAVVGVAALRDQGVELPATMDSSTATAAVAWVTAHRERGYEVRA